MRKTAVVTYLAVGVADVVQIDADDAIPVKKDTRNKLSFHVNMEGNKSISTRTTRVESLFFSFTRTRKGRRRLFFPRRVPSAKLRREKMLASLLMRQHPLRSSAETHSSSLLFHV